MLQKEQTARQENRKSRKDKWWAPRSRLYGSSRLRTASTTGGEGVEGSKGRLRGLMVVCPASRSGRHWRRGRRSRRLIPEEDERGMRKALMVDRQEGRESRMPGALR